MDDCIGKCSLAARCQATDMIGVHMGDEDFIDLIGPVTGRFDIARQRAQGDAQLRDGQDLELALP
jgi:hypothetical protein